MRKSIADNIRNTVAGLYDQGVVDEVTMKNISSLCIPEIEEFKPEKIIAIREKNKLSQAVMGQVINVSPSTIRQWESGKKRPGGASKKLLDLMNRKGVEVLL